LWLSSRVSATLGDSPLTQGVGAMDGSSSERLLTPGEVAALFRVDPKTVTRWAASGRISSIRTPGGHRRFREAEVRELLDGEPSSENGAG
jgi:excisionase family DNA binding protein